MKKDAVEVDESEINNVLHETVIEEIDSEEENEILLEHLRILRS